MATWRCTFTGVIRSLQFGNGVAVTPAAYIRIHVYVHIHTCTSVHTCRVFRRRIPWDPSPADPVEKLKDAKTENCIRRLTRTLLNPREFPGGQAVAASRRNSKFKFKHTRASLSFLSAIRARLHPVSPPQNWNIVLIYGDMSARNKQSRPSLHTRTHARVSTRARINNTRALSPCNRDSDNFRIIASVYYRTRRLFTATLHGFTEV